jgi:hypothetical protein
VFDDVRESDIELEQPMVVLGPEPFGNRPGFEQEIPELISSSGIVVPDAPCALAGLKPTATSFNPGRR